MYSDLDISRGVFRIIRIGRNYDYRFVSKSIMTYDFINHRVFPFDKIVKWNGSAWVEEDGAKAGVKRRGTTSERPAVDDIYIGFQYFDTTLGKMIVRNSSAWTNFDGTALS